MSPLEPNPTPATVTGQELEEAVTLAYEWGELKRLPRTGWLRAGIQQLCGLGQPVWCMMRVMVNVQMTP
jgi:hypothetical protein